MHLNRNACPIPGLASLAHFPGRPCPLGVNPLLL
jgi:hypothetical protein